MGPGSHYIKNIDAQYLYCMYLYCVRMVSRIRLGDMLTKFVRHWTHECNCSNRHLTCDPMLSGLICMRQILTAQDVFRIILDMSQDILDILPGHFTWIFYLDILRTFIPSLDVFRSSLGHYFQTPSRVLGITSGRHEDSLRTSLG